MIARSSIACPGVLYDALQCVAGCLGGVFGMAVGIGAIRGSRHGSG